MRTKTGLGSYPNQDKLIAANECVHVIASSTSFPYTFGPLARGLKPNQGGIRTAGRKSIVAAGRAEEMQRAAVGEHRDVAGRRGRVGLWSEGGRRKAAPAQLGRAGCEMRGGCRGGSEGRGADGRRWSRDGIWGRGAGKGGRRGDGESKGEGEGEGESACDTLDSKGWFNFIIRPS